MKYVIVSGGVLSSVGKGISSSSVGVVLKRHGFNVTAIKIDPYLNVDAGTISPYEHGECFITADGMPVDLDIGSYERFLGVTLSGDHNITTGKIMNHILKTERSGGYLGKTVQLVPHFTDAVINWIEKVAHRPVTPDGKCPDVCIIEIGGTVGDFEISAMVEALRQLTYQKRGDVCHIHVSLIVMLDSTKEFKTKPVQHGVRKLRSYGINPDFLFLRCKQSLPDSVLNKLQFFCQVPQQHVINLPDVGNIYEVPHSLERQQLWPLIADCLHLRSVPRDTIFTDAWDNLLTQFNWSSFPKVRVGIVGKYTELEDTYLSLKHAIHHACAQLQRCPTIVYINAEHIITEEDIVKHNLDAMVVPGGYGSRGIEGMKVALRWARERGVPCLGICLGMQLQVIELMESAGHENVSSEEFVQDPLHLYVVTALYNLGSDIDKSTRLGMKEISLLTGSKVAAMYQSNMTQERHRHRYGVNSQHIEELRKLGMVASGLGRQEDNRIVEIVELVGHPFYVGVQFHPEFNTLPMRAHPLFISLLQIQ